MIKKSVTIQIPKAMESKPMAMLVQMANSYCSSIYLKSGKFTVNAKSIMGIMTLNLSQGEEVQVTTDGADEQEAMQNIEQYLSCAG